MQRVDLGDYFANQGWYPADPGACRAQVDALLADLDEEALPPQALQVGIVPHAGWSFSGGLAAQTIGALAASARQQSRPVDSVILLGGHLGPGQAAWVLKSGRWPTPLGPLETDEELAATFADAAGLPTIGPKAYRPDNTIELQLPLLRACFPEARLVTAGVPADPDCVAVGAAAVAAAQGLGREVVIVGSTDLTHYGPNYGFMSQGTGSAAVRWVKEVNDARAVELLCAVDAERLRAEALSDHFACCPGAAAAACGAAKALGIAQGHCLATLTSYDVHPGSSFVGYAAVVY